MSKLHPQIARLANRYKTHSVGPTHEFHDLRSLASRVYLSQEEALEQVADGNLLALSGPINGRYLFSATALSTLRNKVIDFVASEIANELSDRGVDLERIEMAVQRGLTRQYELSRRVENVLEFDQGNNNGGFVNGVGTGVGIAAGGLGAYAGYKYWKNRKRNADGTPQLPGPNGSGPDADGNYIDVTPKPKSPSGGNGIVAGVERHPGPPIGAKPALTTASPAPNVARQTAGQIAGQDALGNAVRKGKQAIAARGSSILRAIRGAI